MHLFLLVCCGCVLLIALEFLALIAWVCFLEVQEIRHRRQGLRFEPLHKYHK